MGLSTAALTIETPAAPPPQTIGSLDGLRRLALESRLERRVEPDRACALLRTEPEAAAAAYARALLRILPAATGRRIIFHRPGVESLTFDEAWLLRLIEAIRGRDGDSLRFAICSRVARGMRGPVRFLAEGLADRLDNLNLEPF
jgi:hypothetical protein